MGGNQTLAIVVSVKTRRSSFETRNWRFSDVLVFVQFFWSIFPVVVAMKLSRLLCQLKPETRNWRFNCKFRHFGNGGGGRTLEAKLLNTNVLN